MSVEDLDAKQRLVLRSCGVQHQYLHLPLAAFEDAGFFCVLFAVMDQVGHIVFHLLVWTTVVAVFSQTSACSPGQPRTARSR